MVRKFHNHILQTNQRHHEEETPKNNSHKVRKTTKIRKRYNQVPHLTQDTTWESNKNTITSPARAKRSALSQQVTTRQQWESMRNKIHKKQMIHKSTALERLTFLIMVIYDLWPTYSFLLPSSGGFFGNGLHDYFTGLLNDLLDRYYTCW